MIKNFKNDRACCVFEGGLAGLNLSCSTATKNFLHVLDTGGLSAVLLSFPETKIEGEQGYRWSIDARSCICFVWKDGNAHDVEIVDYH